MSLFEEWTWHNVLFGVILMSFYFWLFVLSTWYNLESWKMHASGYVYDGNSREDSVKKGKYATFCKI